MKHEIWIKKAAIQVSFENNNRPIKMNYFLNRLLVAYLQIVADEKGVPGSEWKGRDG